MMDSKTLSQMESYNKVLNLLRDYVGQDTLNYECRLFGKVEIPIPYLAYKIVEELSDNKG